MADPDRPRVWRRRIAGALAAIAWLGVLGYLGAQVFAWLWRPDPSQSGTIETGLTFAALLVQSFTFHAGVALVAVCLLAVVIRRRMLAAVVALLVAVTLGPAAWSHLPPSGDGRGGGDLVVMSANVLCVNDDPGPFLREVGRIDPDVVLIQEYRASWSAAVRGALGAEYPYMVELPAGGAYGEAVLSKTPFLAPPAFGPAGWSWDSPSVVVRVEHGGAEIEIVCVHLWAPLSRRAGAEQRCQAAMLGAWVSARLGGPDAPDGLILAGDFNAPYRSNHLRELRAAGLGEAHHTVGVGRGATWKPRRGLFTIAPGIRIDQVMYAGALRPTAAGVGGDIGSDHRPVWAAFRAE